MSNKSGIIRTIYLYVVSLITIVMMIFSFADLINMAMKQWVFPNADKAYSHRYEPPAVRLESNKELMVKLDKCSEKCKLSEAEQEAIDEWMVEFEEYQQETKEDTRLYQRQNNAIRDISLLIVAIPIFLLHWRIVRREQKNKKA